MNWQVIAKLMLFLMKASLLCTKASVLFHYCMNALCMSNSMGNRAIRD